MEIYNIILCNENELYLSRYSLRNVQFYVKYCKINFYSLANMSSVW